MKEHYSILVAIFSFKYHSVEHSVYFYHTAVVCHSTAEPGDG
jgi:hypothetical protein